MRTKEEIMEGLVSRSDIASELEVRTLEVLTDIRDIWSGLADNLSLILNSPPKVNIQTGCLVPVGPPPPSRVDEKARDLEVADIPSIPNDEPEWEVEHPDDSDS